MEMSASWLFQRENRKKKKLKLEEKVFVLFGKHDEDRLRRRIPGWGAHGGMPVSGHPQLPRAETAQGQDRREAPSHAHVHGTQAGRGAAGSILHPRTPSRVGGHRHQTLLCWLRGAVPRGPPHPCAAEGLFRPELLLGGIHGQVCPHGMCCRILSPFSCASLCCPLRPGSSSAKNCEGTEWQVACLVAWSEAAGSKDMRVRESGPEGAAGRRWDGAVECSCLCVLGDQGRVSQGGRGHFPFHMAAGIGPGNGRSG